MASVILEKNAAVTASDRAADDAVGASCFGVGRRLVRLETGDVGGRKLSCKWDSR